MDEFRRGYDLPLTEKKWQFWLVVAMTPLLIGYVEWSIRVAGMNGWGSWLLRSVDLLWFVVVAVEFVYRFAYVGNLILGLWYLANRFAYLGHHPCVDEHICQLETHVGWK